MPQMSPDSPDSSDMSQVVCSTTKPGMPTRPLLHSPIASPLKGWSRYNAIDTNPDEPCRAEFFMNAGSSRNLSNFENTSSIRCRICLESNTSEELVNICHCSGTMGQLHRSCLEQWLTVAQSGKCEICGFEFKIGVKPPTFHEWLTNGPDAARRRRHMWADGMCLIVMFPLVGLCCWLTFHAFKSYSAVSLRWEVVCLILLFTFILSVFSTWIIIAVRFHYKSWQQWRAENGRMAVENSVNAHHPVNSQRVHLTARNHTSQQSSASSRFVSQYRHQETTGSNSVSHPSGLYPPPFSPPQFSLYGSSPMIDNSILAGNIRPTDENPVVVINYPNQHSQGLQIL